MVDKINANANAMASGLQSRYQTMAYANTVGLDPDIMGLDAGLLNYGGNYGCGGLDTLSLGGMAYGGGMLGGLYGGMYGYNPQKMLNYQKQMYMGNMQLQTEMEDYQLDRNVQRAHKLEGNNFNLSAANNVVEEKMQVLKDQIGANNQDYVQKDFKNAVKALKEKLIETKQVPANVSDEQVSAYLNAMYEKKYHKSVVDALGESGDSQFVHGIKQGLDPLGLCVNQKSAKENMSDLFGYKLSAQDKSDESMGKAVGYVGVAAATLGLIFALPFGARGATRGGGKAVKTWWNACRNVFKTAKTTKA